MSTFRHTAVRRQGVEKVQMLAEGEPSGAGRQEGSICDPDVVTFWGALGCGLNVQEDASPAAFGRRLASGPFSAACGQSRMGLGGSVE